MGSIAHTVKVSEGVTHASPLDGTRAASSRPATSNGSTVVRDRAADDYCAFTSRLRCRIQRRFATRTQSLELSTGLTLPFTRIADPDRVLDDVAAAEDLRERWSGKRAPADQLHLPYWAELWESASGIGNFLIEHGANGVQVAHESVSASGGPASTDSACDAPIPRARASLSGVSVLDLGCGMGLAGTVAAALGANVLFTDLSPDALLFASLNSAPWRHRVRTRRLDWRSDYLSERFDLILGADIVYEKAQWESLDRFWRVHLRGAGRIMLGEPGRQTGELFVPWITARGWSLSEAAQSSRTRPRPLRIFTLERSRGVAGDATDRAAAPV